MYTTCPASGSSDASTADDFPGGAVYSSSRTYLATSVARVFARPNRIRTTKLFPSVKDDGCQDRYIIGILVLRNYNARTPHVGSPHFSFLAVGDRQSRIGGADVVVRLESMG
jgi:hypothetical protein